MRQPQDWGQPCPHPACAHSRLMHRGNSSALAPYLTPSGTRRLCRCHACAVTCSATRATVCFALRTPEDKGIMARKRLLGTVGLADLGVVLGVTEEPGLVWLQCAAHKAHEINAPLLRDLPVPQVHREERWRFSTRKPTQQAEAEGESSALSAAGRQRGWLSFAPACRLLLAAFVGPRPFASAVPRSQMTAAVVVGGRAFSARASAVLCRLSSRRTTRARHVRGQDSAVAPHNRCRSLSRIGSRDRA
jgi:hypothetical protein